LIAFTLGYCSLKKKLVKVDLLYQHFPERLKAIFDSFTSCLSLGLYILIVWQTFIYFKLQYETNVSSLVLYVPRYPFVGILALGFICSTIALLAGVFENISKAMERDGS
jgi:TRAP-type C4-dicarboxylate transport system permease small subunit